ncbi:uncharacterized protein [Clytia hemisphaerica]|uniref:uncharacterized protein n=1 Tax=Clytia hemisphaerica TaxID=252671 RepID=UPI0034D53EC8
MNNEEKWKGYRRHISNKRTGGGDNKNVKKVSTLMVQKMNPVPVGKLKKYEPERPRDFIDFSAFSKLTLKNVKDACEKFYNELPGSCDVLYDITGPSCTNDEQVSGMKVFRVRFVNPTNNDHLLEPSSSKAINQSSSSSKRVNDSTDSNNSIPVKSKRKRVSSILLPKKPHLQEDMPVSISIGGILQAGKLVTPTLDNEVTLTLESFNIKHKIWLKGETSKFHMQTEKFAEGGFRNAFKAYTTENGTTKIWVIKKFKESAWNVCGPRYNMTLEEHTRKQVQMHTAAKAITAKCMKKPGFRENWFQYQTIQFALLNGEPITVEPYVEGDFIKYINNNGVSCKRKSGRDIL